MTASPLLGSIGADITTILSRVTAAVATAASLSTLATAVAAIPTSMVQSVQYVSIAIADAATLNTGTISSVNTAKAVLIPNGFDTGSAAATPDDVNPKANLTNATTITVSREGNTGISNTRWVVLELK